MHAETTPLLYHTDKALHKQWVLLGKLGKFVDDDKEMWQRLNGCKVLCTLPHRLVLGNVLDARCAQNMLTPPQLAFQSNKRSFRKSSAEVRHHTYSMRYIFEWFECSAALEVYQDKIDEMRMVS